MEVMSLIFDHLSARFLTNISLFSKFKFRIIDLSIALELQYVVFACLCCRRSVYFHFELIRIVP
jgi:hypothetical protein